MSLLKDEIKNVLRVRGVTAKRFLDMGCGDGSMTLSIAEIIKAYEVYGADLDKASLDKLPQLITGIRFDFESLKDSTLPFKKECFDVISAIEFIEHLSFGDGLMQEANRLLVPGGFFLITTPNLASLSNRLLLFMGYQPLYTAPSKYYHVGSRRVAKKFPISEYGHKNLYTLRALTDLLELNNFEIIVRVGAQSNYDSLSFLPVARFPSLAPNIIILSRKKAFTCDENKIRGVLDFFNT